jgi:hypothetical protein
MELSYITVYYIRARIELENNSQFLFLGIMTLSNTANCNDRVSLWTREPFFGCDFCVYTQNS